MDNSSNGSSGCSRFKGLHFEPHRGFGTVIDGEPFPFGYISEAGYGNPVFEITPIFEYNPHHLRDLALQMAAAPELLEALKETIAVAARNERGAWFDKARAAISKAEGK